MNDAANENDASNNNNINNNKTIASKCFEYKTEIIESTLNSNSRLNAEVVVSLTYLSNF